MSEDGNTPEETRQGPDVPRPVLGQLAGLALWKKGCLLCSVVLMVVGLGLPFVTSGGGEVSSEASASAIAGTDALSAARRAHGLDGGDIASATSPVQLDSADESGSELSPMVFRLGFSFFVGFALAFALRSFLRISVAVIGLWLLLMFGLEYAGLIEVRWGAVAEHYDSVAGWLRGETASFRTFVMGRVPAMGVAGAGFFIGLRRK